MLNEWGEKIFDPSGAIWDNLTNKSLISAVTRPKFSSFLDSGSRMGSCLSSKGETFLIPSRPGWASHILNARIQC